MVLQTKDKITICPKCGKTLRSDHGDPYCLDHGTISPAPISDPIHSHKSKPVATPGTAGASAVSESADGQAAAGASTGSAPGDPSKDANGADQPDPDKTNKKPGTKSEIHKYYLENKNRIIADYQKLGVVPTAKNWDMSPPTLRKLLDAWGVRQIIGRANTRRLNTRRTVATPPSEPGSASQTAVLVRPALPALPPFDAEWDPELQLKWMGIYEQLVNE